MGKAQCALRPRQTRVTFFWGPISQLIQGPSDCPDLRNESFLSQLTSNLPNARPFYPGKNLQLLGNVAGCPLAPVTASAMFSAVFSGTIRSLLKCIETVFDTPRSSMVTP